MSDERCEQPLNDESGVMVVVTIAHDNWGKLEAINELLGIKPDKFLSDGLNATLRRW